MLTIFIPPLCNIFYQQPVRMQVRYVYTLLPSEDYEIY